MISIAELDASIGLPEFTRLSIRRGLLATGGTYAEFIELLYLDIDNGIYAMQRDLHLLQGETEDQLTGALLRPLRQLGYHAEHDASSGGHVDLSVTLGQHSWIAEAKRDGSFEEGLKQLVDRYVPTSGNYAHDCGGLLMYYVDTDNAYGRLGEWKVELESAQIPCADCKSNRLAMFSTHRLKGPGLPYNVRTMVVSLYHQPTDRAANLKAARHEAKAKRLASQPDPTAGSSA